MATREELLKQLEAEEETPEIKKGETLNLRFNQQQRADGSGSSQQEEHWWAYSER